MTFGDAFLSQFLAGLAVATIAAISLTGFWLFMKDGWKKTCDFVGRSFLILRLRFSFTWIVVKRRLGRSGAQNWSWHNWSWLERIRRANLDLVSHGPKVRSRELAKLRKRQLRTLARLDDFVSRSSKYLLEEAAASMELRLLDTPTPDKWATTSDVDKAEWLTSKSPADLARWSLRLNEHDRERWKSWLQSSNALADIRSSFADERTHSQI